MNQPPGSDKDHFQASETSIKLELMIKMNSVCSLKNIMTALEGVIKKSK